MTVNGRCFVEWKEQFVSQEHGHRVVHYYLKDSDGQSILAVVGTERSVRHMFYVVAEEFLEICGKEGSIPSGFKWRPRREVVDWLTSTLSKQHLQGDGNVLPSHNLAQTHEATDSNIIEVGALPRRTADDKIQFFVFVMANGESHYIAYLEDMYEDQRGQKKVKVRWFHHNQEVKGVILAQILTLGKFLSRLILKSLVQSVLMVLPQS